MGRKHRKTNGAVAPELLQCDLATGQGLIRMAEGLVREFAAGELAQERFEALMSGLEVIAALRRQFHSGEKGGASSSQRLTASTDGTPADGETMAEGAAVNGAQTNSSRVLSTKRRPATATHKSGASRVALKSVKGRALLTSPAPAAPAAGAHRARACPEPGEGSLADIHVGKRVRAQRRHQAVDFVNAFASGVTPAKPKSSAKLRPIGPDTVDLIPKSFL